MDVKEQWYIFVPEDKKFKPVNFDKLPENPGFVFLKRGIYEKRSGKGGYLRLFSPFGEEILAYNGYLNEKSSVKRFNENQQHMVNLTYELSTTSNKVKSQ